MWVQCKSDSHTKSVATWNSLIAYICHFRERLFPRLMIGVCVHKYIHIVPSAKRIKWIFSLNGRRKCSSKQNILDLVDRKWEEEKIVLLYYAAFCSCIEWVSDIISCSVIKVDRVHWIRKNRKEEEEEQHSTLTQSFSSPFAFIHRHATKTSYSFGKKRTAKSCHNFRNIYIRLTFISQLICISTWRPTYAKLFKKQFKQMQCMYCNC